MDVINKIKRIYKYIWYGIPVSVNNIVKVDIKTFDKNCLLEGKVALITGGTSGIGLEIARLFMKSGATVIVTGRNPRRLDDAVTSLREQNSENIANIFPYCLDNQKIEDIKKCIASILKQYSLKQIDILVNNAGIGNCPDARTEEENFDAIIDTNLKGTFFMAKYFAEYLKDNGIKGNILNIASSSSERPATNAYTLSKWGVKGLTKGLARVYTTNGIVINAIAPGPTATPMIKGNCNDENLSHPNSLTGRLVHPCEVANVALFMVSDMARMIVGNIVYISGGSGNIYNEDINYFF